MVKNQLAKFAIIAAIAGTAVIWWAIATRPDGKLHVYLCDVGQGDGILVSRGMQQMLVDGGPNGRIENCLAEKMWILDRKIEVVVMTHPQADHMAGLVGVVRKYKVDKFVAPEVGNTSLVYQELMRLLDEKNIKIDYVTACDTVAFDGFGHQMMYLDIVWPTEKMVKEYKKGDDLNKYALVGRLAYGDFDMLLTGDADAQVDDEMMTDLGISNVEVLKVPHHGSKTGMTKEWLSRVSPEAAIISSGQGNRYGHPTKEALEMLDTVGARIYRTDQLGTVEVVSDGQRWWIRNL
jgi:beta-lactamase superfamily II metal-dependent hydrolase